MSLRRILGDPAAAQRAADYAAKPPLERMRDGDPRPSYVAKNARPSVAEQTRRAVLGSPRPISPASEAPRGPTAPASGSVATDTEDVFAGF